MYAVDEHDRVVELAEIPRPATGAPQPIVIADEQAVVLSYLTEEQESPEGLLALCLVRFDLAWTHLFGAPNDEALEGHPLWSRGLGYYSVFRVGDSSLVRLLARMNSVHERHSWSTFDSLTHYIFTFHDSTFECVARSYEVVTERASRHDRQGKALELLERIPPRDPSRYLRSDPAHRLYRWLPAGFRYLFDFFGF